MFIYLVAFILCVLGVSVIALLDLFVSPGGIGWIVLLVCFLGWIPFSILLSASWVVQMVLGRKLNEREMFSQDYQVGKATCVGIFLTTGGITLVLASLPTIYFSFNDALIWTFRGPPLPEVLSAENPLQAWPTSSVSIHHVRAGQISTQAHQTRHPGKSNFVHLREDWLGLLTLPAHPSLLIRYECFSQGCEPPWMTQTEEAPIALDGLLIASTYRGWDWELPSEVEHLPILLLGKNAANYRLVALLGVLLASAPAIGLLGAALYLRKIRPLIKPDAEQDAEKILTRKSSPNPTLRKPATSPKPTPHLKPSAPTKQRKRKKRHKK
jgi:hypothetical protein